jgi:probable rRNA maturation factor
MKLQAGAIPELSVRNLQRKIRVDVVDLRKFGQRALKLCLDVPRQEQTDLQKLQEVLVLIVSDQRIAFLHRQFMHEAGPTDVLTFQHGEIFISVETARRNARRFGKRLDYELCLYIVHGLLHLHGFDDRDQASARKMRVVQQRIVTDARSLN